MMNVDLEIKAKHPSSGRHVRFAVFGFGLFISSIPAQNVAGVRGHEIPSSFDVCTAIDRATKGKVLLRGVGQLTPDGFVLGDRTCPVATTIGDELPAVILLEVNSFASNDDRNRFEKMHTSRHGMSDLYQVLVRGSLQCRAGFRYQTSDDGEIVLGNGYGSHGLALCKLSKGEVLRLRGVK